MSAKPRILVSLLIAAMTLPVAAGAAEEAKAKTKSAEQVGKPVELGSFLCKDIMRMSGEDRQIALGLLHGYYMGKKAATSYVPSSLSKASDDFIEYCLDHPSNKALDAFAQFAK